MEYKVWRLLYEELNGEIEIWKNDSEPFLNTYKGEWPVVQYDSFCNDLVQDFISECRSNIDEFNQVPLSFKDLLFKLDFLFTDQFSVPFPEGAIFYPLNYHQNIIPAVNSSHDPLISVAHLKINVFSMSIRYLRKQLYVQSQPKITHRTRTKADIRDFRTNLTSVQLSEILKMGKRKGLFSPDTNQKDFIDIYFGRPSANPINWTCSIYSLSKFIKGINGKGINKLTDGKWLVISQLFIANGQKILEHSLLKPGIGKNDHLENVEDLIYYFNNPTDLDD